MKTLYEKITFMVTALAYILFHLAIALWEGGGYRIDVDGTVTTLLNTLPFEMGMTYIAIAFIRRASGGKRPAWDRILRIFFTIGILFGLIYNLYIMGAREQERLNQNKPTVSLFWDHDIRKVRSHSA